MIIGIAEKIKNEKWDKRFLNLAEYISQWSKDPSTKVGAVIVDEDKRIVSTGYNGFPRGVNDNEILYKNRDVKYKRIVHAERNAIIFARQNLKDCVIYTTPFPPCSVCAGMIIQTGIKRIVSWYPLPEEEELIKRWEDDFLHAAEMYASSGVILDFKIRKNNEYKINSNN